MGEILKWTDFDGNPVPIENRKPEGDSGGNTNWEIGGFIGLGAGVLGLGDIIRGVTTGENNLTVRGAAEVAFAGAAIIYTANQGDKEHQ